MLLSCAIKYDSRNLRVKWKYRYTLRRGAMKNTQWQEGNNGLCCIKIKINMMYSERVLKTLKHMKFCYVMKKSDFENNH